MNGAASHSSPASTDSDSLKNHGGHTGARLFYSIPRAGGTLGSRDGCPTNAAGPLVVQASRLHIG